MNLRPDDLLPLPAGVRIRRLADGAAVGRYLRTDLSTVFQPLFASDTGGIAGHEERCGGDADSQQERRNARNGPHGAPLENQISERLNTLRTQLVSSFRSTYIIRRVC